MEPILLELVENHWRNVHTCNLRIAEALKPDCHQVPTLCKIQLGGPKPDFEGGTKCSPLRHCRKLDKIRKLWLSLPTNEAISYYLSKSSIDWHFIPPSSPHFGGIWESGIRSIKFHLKRVLGETILTFEELTTLLTQIEGLLNSRPLIR
ncbi:DNA double-strand break repair Rad50 ATPase [Trichonephila clavipes]|nr:DNA double-strand break repair Rad50 ATPase [Trichonephila clavipes]